MSGQYVRRFRMEFNFLKTPLATPELASGYRWVAWQRRLLKVHASVKHESFSLEFDSRVFPCLGEYDGCLRLMKDISKQQGFLPGATWLISSEAAGSAYCATIQGLAQPSGIGAIQNVGVLPLHRGVGLGRALVLKSLHGFQQAGLKRVYLEVTADNLIAVELYRSLGFERTRTLYKPVETPLHVDSPALSV